MSNNSKPPAHLKRWHGDSEGPKNVFAGYSEDGQQCKACKRGAPGRPFTPQSVTTSSDSEEGGSGRKWVNDNTT
jgi:hypothetical protein